MEHLKKIIEAERAEAFFSEAKTIFFSIYAIIVLIF